MPPAPACGGNFFDTGGITGSYADGENITTTVCPTIAGEQVTVTFTSFDTEIGFDVLKVFDGSAVGTLLGSFNGTTLPPSFTATAPNGCLTFVFTSDVGGTRPGWSSTISCAPAPTCIKPINITASTVLTTSAIIGWTQNPNPGGSTATAWQIIALPCSSLMPTTTSAGWISAPTNPFIIKGLTPSTCYNFYVRAVCSPTDTSSWSMAATGTTRILPPVCGGVFVD